MPVNLKPDKASVLRNIPQKGILSFYGKQCQKNINKTTDYSQGEKCLLPTILMVIDGYKRFMI